MQLQDLVKPIEQQTDEELLERLRVIRHSRTVLRPAAKRHVKKAAAKVSKAKVKKAGNTLDDLIKDMTPEQVAQLLLDLGAT